MTFTKQVIVVRKDLNMRKGKIAAQVAHASLGVFAKDWEHKNRAIFPNIIEDPAVVSWFNTSFAKICVYVTSEAELFAIRDKAIAANLPHYLILDSGKTEFKNVPTYTCCAVGPGWNQDIDLITGELPLL